MKYKSGEDFLNKIYPDLYKRHLVNNHTLKSDTPTEKINGSLSLKSLTSVEGLVLPEILKGDLYLDSLTSVEDLELPKIINGSLSI